jgi:hypothetical protein
MCDVGKEFRYFSSLQFILRRIWTPNGYLSSWHLELCLTDMDEKFFKKVAQNPVPVPSSFVAHSTPH